MYYLQNVNTNVSNAKMNIPKAIRSLKSNGFLSISTTPILCKNRGHPPCNTVVLFLSYHLMAILSIKNPVLLKESSVPVSLMDMVNPKVVSSLLQYHAWFLYVITKRSSSWGKLPFSHHNTVSEWAALHWALKDMRQIIHQQSRKYCHRYSFLGSICGQRL